VLAATDALKLNRPVLVGHSLGGEELSSVGSRYPERVAGLIYLDAAYVYAFYDSSGPGNWVVDMPELQQKLQQLRLGEGPPDVRPLIQELLTTTLPQVEKDLRDLQKGVENTPALFAPPSKPQPAAISAITAGYQKYTHIPVPVLAIFALPHQPSIGPEDGSQARAFEKGVPSARVVRLPQANHYVYRSNEADVLREINAFYDDPAVMEHAAKTC
jgi:non-heme chloroperoxidase